MAYSYMRQSDYLSTTNLTTHTVNLPASTPSGRLLVLALSADLNLAAGNPVLANANAGKPFTRAAQTVAYVAVEIWYRITDGTETTIAVTLTGSTALGGSCLEYTGPPGSGFIDATGSSSPYGITCRTQVINLANTFDLVVAIAGNDGSGTFYSNLRASTEGSLQPAWNTRLIGNTTGGGQDQNLSIMDALLGDGTGSIGSVWDCVSTTQHSSVIVGFNSAAPVLTPGIVIYG